MEVGSKFWGKVKILGDDDCWEWQGGCFAAGYGCYKRNILAHRYAWETQYGSLGAMEIDHICRNKKCLNLAHLRAVPKGYNGQQGRETKWKRFYDGLFCGNGLHLRTPSTWKPIGKKKVYRCIPCHKARNKSYYKRNKDGLQ